MINVGDLVISQWLWSNIVPRETVMRVEMIGALGSGLYPGLAMCSWERPGFKRAESVHRIANLVVVKKFNSLKSE